MTNRVSPFGALSDRISRTRTPAPAQRTRPEHGQHVEVLDAGHWRPGLLVTWKRDHDGHWWAEVVTADHGTALVTLYAAHLLRPLRAGTSATPT